MSHQNVNSLLSCFSSAAFFPKSFALSSVNKDGGSLSFVADDSSSNFFPDIRSSQGHSIGCISFGFFGKRPMLQFLSSLCSLKAATLRLCFFPCKWSFKPS
ncbi:hypothetical protein MTR67_044477 [Solanum verrucosum]|uniref:Uncharacterized protein n=1 Tax=Solanum verrucosum TaxID=315347 RepID=A0AAF0ZSY6_SOLVR|nr:hypothetical protein MTR67_044477 [Solanum verrucosum]